MIDHLPCTLLSIDVRGVPVTQGSMKAIVARRSRRAIVIPDHRDELMSWREAIASEARRALRGAATWEGPVEVRLHFHLRRPKSAPKRRIRPDARPDIDKLARAVLDALTGLAYADDGQVVGLYVDKHWSTPDQPTGVAITVAEVVYP